MNVKERIAEVVESALRQAAADGVLGSADLPIPKIEYPREEKHGDYATPVAMESARILKKSPLEIGAVLKTYIERSELAGAVEVAKPGFINIFLDHDFLFGLMEDILREGDGYGRQIKKRPRLINIEFVSANPTGPLNIVSARAAAVGDVVANLLEACGDTVEREFYVNDYGNQVLLLGRSVLCRYRELEGMNVEFPEEGYHGEYIRDIAAYIRDNFAKEVNAAADEETLVDFMAQKAVEYNVRGQKRDLERFNVRFKRWFLESGLHSDGSVDETLRTLEGLGVIYEEDGKTVFRSTDFGDDKDRVVVRDDGRPTYLLADIAYHRNKKERGYDLIIDIWGPDHHGYIARLAGAMKAMGCPDHAFRVLIAQQVNLVVEGEMVKMSKRLGKFSTMSELLDEIGVDVARYFFTMRSTDSHLDFDLALAKRQSSENPVFYLQYAHARICSIFREAEKRGFAYDPRARDFARLKNPEAIVLLKLLARFPEEVADAAASFEPHRIASFLMRLAQSYHRFYTEHRVLADDPIEANSNMALCDCVRIVMKNGLALLGVSAPEKM